MSIEELHTLLAGRPQVEAIRTYLRKRSGHLLLTGLHASERFFILSELATELPLFIVMDNQDEAQYAYADLQTLEAKVLYFPTSRRRRQGVDEAMQIQRTEVLTALSQESKVESRKSKATSQMPGRSPIVVTYPEAISEPVPEEETLRKSSLTIAQGETIALTTLSEQLAELNFERVDFVYQPGQYAIRGGIVDVYSYSHDDPYRLDFFGDEVDSIRTFDIETQLSKERVQQAGITGAGAQETDTASIVDYLPEKIVWVSNDWSVVKFKLDSQEFQGLLDNLIKTVELAEKSYFPTYEKIAFNTLPQPIFHKNFDLLVEDLQKRSLEGYHIYILADQKKQTDRLQAIFEQIAESNQQTPIRFTAVDKTLHAGFVDNEAKVCCYTDHEIFERYHRVSLQSENARRGKAAPAACMPYRAKCRLL